MILRAFVLNADEQNAISTQHSSNRGHVLLLLFHSSRSQSGWSVLAAWNVSGFMECLHSAALSRGCAEPTLVLFSCYGAASWLFLWMMNFRETCIVFPLQPHINCCHPLLEGNVIYRSASSGHIGHHNQVIVRCNPLDLIHREWGVSGIFNPNTSEDEGCE